MTISIIPTTDDLGLAPVFATTPLVITAPIPASGPAMASYRMELWKRPHESGSVGALPLASTAGIVSGSNVTFTFSAAQMDQTLNNQVNSNNFWIVIGGLDADGFPYSLRAGNLEIKPSALSLQPDTSITFTVVNGVASYVFSGTTYSFDVIAGAATTSTDYRVIDDVASFVYNGILYSYDAVLDPTFGPIDTSVVVIDEMLIVTANGQSYSVPAVIANP
jgi:hypothetical protein